MSVSVVLVHYETPDLLRDCLESLRAEAPLEILVVDNSRRRKARAVVEAFPGVRLLENKDNQGFARAVNQGLAATAGDWVLVLNPDTVVEPGALAALEAFGNDHADAGIVAPRLLNTDGTLQYSCRRFYTLKTLLYRRTLLARWMGHSQTTRRHLMQDFDHSEPRVVDWVLGGAMMVRRSAVVDVGGADERFFLYFEDVDWCYRMGKRGWKVWYLPQATVQHRHRRDSARDFTGLRRHVLSTLQFYDKWSLLLYVAKRARNRLRAPALLVSDILATNLAFYLAFLLRGQLAFRLTKPLFPFTYYSNFLMLINLVMLGTLMARGAYRRRYADRAEMLVELIKSVALVCLVVMAATYAAYVKSYSRALVPLFLPLAVAAIFAGRCWVDRPWGAARSRSGLRRRAMLLGVEPVLSDAARWLAQGPSADEWCGRIDLERVGEGRPVGELADRVADQLRDERVQLAVVCVPAARAEDYWPVVERCRAMGLEQFVFTELTPWIHGEDQMARFGPMRMLRVLPETPVAGSPWVRRAVELLVALLLIPPVLVALGISWLALLLVGRSPRWEHEVWDNGRAEPVPVYRLGSRGGGAGLAERLGLTRGLLLFWVLTGRVGLVGAPMQRFASPGAAGSRNGRGVPAGLTGVWFVEPDAGWSEAEVRRRAQASDVTADLQILVRSAARILRGGGR